MQTEDIKAKLAEMSPEFRTRARTFLNLESVQKLSRNARIRRLQTVLKIEELPAIVVDKANQLYLL